MARKITAAMLNQKYQEYNLKGNVNLYNIEVSKVGGEYGCGYQDKYDKVVMTVRLLGFGMDAKEG